MLSTLEEDDACHHLILNGFGSPKANLLAVTPPSQNSSTLYSHIEYFLFTMPKNDIPEFQGAKVLPRAGIEPAIFSCRHTSETRYHCAIRALQNELALLKTIMIDFCSRALTLISHFISIASICSG